jgi:preprotein translocase SecE subunit
MANAKKPTIGKKRVRKAPTIREQAEVARAKAESGKEPGRIGKLKSKSGSALKKTRITHNPITKILAKTGRFLLKVLRFLIPNYFINSWREVKLVTWPTRSETWRLTSAVFIFAVVFGAMVSGVDKVLDLIFKKLILK